jgi:hypothetical protein
MRTRIMSMSIVKRRIAIAVAGSLAIVLFTFVGGEAVKLLWNWLLPPLFGLPVVSFWQALGLLVLSRILFGGFGRHGGRRWRVKDEDRERIRQRMRERWGVEPPRPADWENLL